MAKKQNPAGTSPKPPVQDPAKRDFLMLTTGAVGAIGCAGAAWPLLDSIRPARDVLALSTTEVDIGDLQPGQSRTVMWRGMPVFIRYRTEEEIAEARAVDISQLPDPQTDEERVHRPEILVMVGKCTHLGCVPSGQKMSDNKGDYNGWYCPCHGSHYDTSGRIRRGPAVRNMDVPAYAFLSETRIIIGQEGDNNAA